MFRNVTLSRQRAVLAVVAMLVLAVLSCSGSGGADVGGGEEGTPSGDGGGDGGGTAVPLPDSGGEGTAMPMPTATPLVGEVQSGQTQSEGGHPEPEEGVFVRGAAGGSGDSGSSGAAVGGAESGTGSSEVPDQTESLPVTGGGGGADQSDSVAEQNLSDDSPADDSDDDADGLPNTYELIFGTDPHNPDTDGDGLLDSLEVKIQTDPLKQDTDGDGLLDAYEVLSYGTDPTDPQDPLSPVLQSVSDLAARDQAGGGAQPTLEVAENPDAAAGFAPPAPQAQGEVTAPDLSSERAQAPGASQLPTELGRGTVSALAPMELKLGESASVRVVVKLLAGVDAPSAEPIATVTAREANPEEAWLDFYAELPVHEWMKARISASGFAAETASDPIQSVAADRPAIWVWTLTAQKAGLRNVTVTVSVPDIVDGSPHPELSTPAQIIEFEVSVPGAEPTAEAVVAEGPSTQTPAAGGGPRTVAIPPQQAASGLRSVGIEIIAGLIVAGLAAVGGSLWAWIQGRTGKKPDGSDDQPPSRAEEGLPNDEPETGDGTDGEPNQPA